MHKIRSPFLREALSGVGNKTDQSAKNEGGTSTRSEKITFNFQDYLKSIPVLPEGDSWLEKRNFEELLVNQPELLRARVRKMFNELQSLRKDLQIAEDAQNDFQVRLQIVTTVAHKLRAFENWELSTFGRLLNSIERSHTMGTFLKKLAKDDDHAYATAENFCKAWGINTTSNQGLIMKVAEQYSNEISSLAYCIHKWCELHIIEERFVNTKYLDLIVNAGLVEIPDVRTKAICEGYTRWATMFISTHSTEHTPAKSALYFHPENSTEKYKNISTNVGKKSFTKPLEAISTRQIGNTIPSKTNKVKTSTATTLDSREELFTATLFEDPTETSFTTRNASKYRLPNW